LFFHGQAKNSGFLIVIYKVTKNQVEIFRLRSFAIPIQSILSIKNSQDNTETPKNDVVLACSG